MLIEIIGAWRRDRVPTTRKYLLHVQVLYTQHICVNTAYHRIIYHYIIRLSMNFKIVGTGAKRIWANRSFARTSRVCRFAFQPDVRRNTDSIWLQVRPLLCYILTITCIILNFDFFLFSHRSKEDESERQTGRQIIPIYIIGRLPSLSHVQLHYLFAIYHCCGQLGVIALKRVFPRFFIRFPDSSIFAIKHYSLLCRLKKMMCLSSLTWYYIFRSI